MANRIVCYCPRRQDAHRRARFQRSTPHLRPHRFGATRLIVVAMLAVTAFTVSPLAQSEVYTCVDADGRRTLRNEPCNKGRQQAANPRPQPLAPPLTNAGNQEALRRQQSEARHQETVERLRAGCEKYTAEARTPGPNNWKAKTLATSFCADYRIAAARRR